VELDALTRAAQEWPAKKTAIHKFGGLPRTWRSQTLGIIGYGVLGKAPRKSGIAGEFS
jgi:phosphoglycerate dehydrogenase-like enzyme